MTRTNGKNCSFYHFRTEQIEDGKRIERRFLTVDDIKEEFGISTYIIYNSINNPKYTPKKVDIKVFRERVPVVTSEIKRTPDYIVTELE